MLYSHTLFSTALPTDSTLFEGSGIEPRTVATLALLAYLLSNNKMYSIMYWPCSRLHFRPFYDYYYSDIEFPILNKNIREKMATFFATETRTSNAKINCNVLTNRIRFSRERTR